MKRLALALSAGVSFVSLAVAQVAPTMPSTGAPVPPTPTGAQALISATPWINGRGLIGGPNWRDNYQELLNILNGMGTWSPQGVYTPSGVTPAGIGALNKAGDTAAGILGVANNAACDTSQWTGAVSGGAAIPIPVCSATKMAFANSIPFAAVVGINAGSTNDPTHLQFAQHLIQSVTSMDNNHQEDALTINFVSKTGGGGLPTNGWSEKVALYAPTLMMPGANNTWVFNPDLVIQAGVGNYSGFNSEFDLTNFNGDYAVGGCPIVNGSPQCPTGQINANAAGTFRTFLGSPVTAGDWFAASGSPSGSFTASTTAGQNTITTSGAAPFHGDLLTGSGIPPYTYVSNTSTSNGTTTVTMTNNATATASNVTIAQQSFNMHIGTFYQGSALVRDATINDSTNSRISYQLYGTHDRAFDTSLATINYAFVANSGQRFCLNGLGGCFYGDTTAIPIKFSSPIGIVGVDSAGSGIGLDINSLANNIPAMVHYTNAATANWGAGLDADGSFAWYINRFPGGAGTRVADITSTGALILTASNLTLQSATLNGKAFLQSAQPLSIFGVDSTATGVVLDLSSNTKNVAAMVHYTDQATYNISAGAGTTGNFEWWNNRFPGSTGTMIASLSSAGLFNAASYAVGGTAGASCSGTPSSNFATSNGVTIHC